MINNQGLKAGDRVVYTDYDGKEYAGTMTEPLNGPWAYLKFDTPVPRAPDMGKFPGNGVIWRNLRLLPTAVDHTKPIVANTPDDLFNRPYTYEGEFTRYPGGQRLLVVRNQRAMADSLLVDPITGKVVPQYDGDRRGSSLVFSNKREPEVVLYLHSIYIGGQSVQVQVAVTMTDGEVTDVVWQR